MQMNTDFKAHEKMPYGLAPGGTALLVIDMNDENVAQGWDETEYGNNYRMATKAIQLISEQLKKSSPYVKRIWFADQNILPFEMSDNASKEQADEHTRIMRTYDRAGVLSHFKTFSHDDTDAIFLKTTRNAFGNGWNVDTGEGLAAYLHRHKIQNILICGAAITQCVLSTALAAKQLGFNVLCVDEAITGGTTVRRRDAIDDLYDKGITVSSVHEVFPVYGMDTQKLGEELEAVYEGLPRRASMLDRIIAHLGRGLEHRHS